MIHNIVQMMVMVLMVFVILPFSAFGELFTKNAGVTLTLTSVDPGENPSGVHKMKFSIDGVGWGEEEDYTSTKEWTLSQEGYQCIYVMFMDKAGNESPSYSACITLDTIPPNGEITIEGNGIIDININVNVDVNPF